MTNARIASSSDHATAQPPTIATRIRTASTARAYPRAKLRAMAETDVSAVPFSGRTAWTRSMQTPLRQFLATETGGAAVLLGAVVVGLVWANLGGSYERLWSTTLAIRLGALGLASRSATGSTAADDPLLPRRGLEARREIDLGELRERRRCFQ